MGLIELTKKAQIVLEKKGAKNIKPMRVGFAIDISGSMKDEYDDGIVQTTFDRILSIAKNLDNNGEMDVWTFNIIPSVAPMAVEADYGTYIKRKILDNSNISKWGGTAFEPVLKLTLDHYFRGIKTIKKEGAFLGIFGGKKIEEIKKPKDIELPAMVILITDGESSISDNDLTDLLFKDSEKYNIYFNLVAVSNQANFSFLEKMAKKYKNVGFVNIKNLKATDEEILDLVITDEVVSFLNK
jgi:hypothetical protein